MPEDQSRRDRTGIADDVPIDVLVTVGRARPTVRDLVALQEDEILMLDSQVDDPVELFVGDRLIARGELQEIEGGGGRLGVRLTHVAGATDEG